MTNIFQSIYDLLNIYLFGGTAAQGSYPDLICLVLATYCILYLIALPFKMVSVISPIRLFRG